MMVNSQIFILLQNSYLLELKVNGNLKNIFRLPEKVNSNLLFIDNSILYFNQKNKLIILN